MFYKAREAIALKVQSPLLRLIVMDWRFACMVLVFFAFLVVVGLLPYKFIQRSPKGSLPVLKVSAIDLLQAQSLKQAALRAEQKADWKTAESCWQIALANDPGSVEIAEGLIHSLMRNPRPKSVAHAYYVSGWLTNIAPQKSLSYQLWIQTADRHREWENLLRAIPTLPIAQTDFARYYTFRARYFTGQHLAALSMLPQLDAARHPSLKIYREALSIIYPPNPSVRAQSIAALKVMMKDPAIALEAHEAYMIACAALRNTEEFAATLKSISSLTDYRVPYEIAYARLLLSLGRRDQAALAVENLTIPHSLSELLANALMLVELGKIDHAISLLEVTCRSYPNHIEPWVLHATLLIAENKIENLRRLFASIERFKMDAAFATFRRGLHAAIDAHPGNLESFLRALATVDFPNRIVLANFAADILSKARKPDLAVQALLLTESRRSSEPEFYRRLFELADASRDSDLMLRAARAWHQLAPHNLNASANYTAMLSMFDQDPSLALDLASKCLDAAPATTSVRINYIAALINADKLASAAQMLALFDPVSLSPYEHSHFNFLRTKLAFKKLDQQTFSQLANSIPVSDLYPQQREWLRNATNSSSSNPLAAGTK